MSTNKILISGEFNGDNYIGNVTEQGDNFVGSVHQVPEPETTQVFFEHSTALFDTYEEAEKFVFDEWKRKFEK